MAARGQPVLQPQRQVLVGRQGSVRGGKRRQNEDEWLHARLLVCGFGFLRYETGIVCWLNP